MSITFNEKSKTFNISTKNTSYICGIADSGLLVHIYYGKKTGDIGCTEDLTAYYGNAFTPIEPDIVNGTGANTAQFEYQSADTDYRTPAISVIAADGSPTVRLRYKSHKIFDGKPKLSGLPAVYTESDSEAQTLIITLKDDYTGLTVDLKYTAMYEFDAITRSAEIINNGTADASVMCALSCMVDFCGTDFDFVHLHGAWARERHIERVHVAHGNISIDSKRGASSHHHNPFFALCSKNADEDAGEVYGFNLIYSGNFIAGAEKNAWDITRAYIGINPFNFKWNLKPGESFVTPEAVLVYSDSGFGKMSRIYHKLYRTRLARGKYRDTSRPVLINNWEATYMEFDEEKILDIAKKAKDLGIELMVLDDGWFGHRDSDNSSLGDWYSDKRKLPNGVEGLAKKVTEMGMKFGLWFEPEMISPDSDLMKAHPDWYMHTNDRAPALGRNQLILDYTRDDVCEYIINAVSNILENAPVSYVKWDMNRNMSDIGSPMLSAQNQQEAAHRYILGLYKVMDALTSRFPDVLFESCSGGGGRFDGGILYYMPQGWTSDDTDAVERMYIQYGTSLVYPSSCMAAHVSAVPNHQTGRVTPLKTRGDVAMCGRFGYELDLTKLTAEESEIVKEQINRYHKLEGIIHNGDMYRIKSPFEGNTVSWEFVSEDKNTVVLCVYKILTKVEHELESIKLKGLIPDAMYKNTQTGNIYRGDALMNIGLKKHGFTDFSSEITVFEKL